MWGSVVKKYIYTPTILLKVIQNEKIKKVKFKINNKDNNIHKCEAMKQ